MPKCSGKICISDISGSCYLGYETDFKCTIITLRSSSIHGKSLLYSEIFGGEQQNTNGVLGNIFSKVTQISSRE